MIGKIEYRPPRLYKSLKREKKHHDPGDLYKVEIFINKGDCQNNYYSPNNCSSADPDEIFSRWNLEGKSGSVSCVSGMTMWGNEYNESGKTEGFQAENNSLHQNHLTNRVDSRWICIRCFFKLHLQQSCLT